MVKKTGTWQELLTTKRYNPLMHPGLVSRPRLVQLLEQGLENVVNLLPALRL